MNSNLTGKVRLIASDKNWIEGSAVSQLRGTAELEGMEFAVGLPDLHPGKTGPVGAAFVSSGRLFPHLVGNDVGCGMGLWLSELNSKKVKLDRWADKITGLDRTWDGDRAKWLEQFNVAPGDFDAPLGTVGGGNHFAELQAVESVSDASQLGELGLQADSLVLLVHSGSRGLGQHVLRSHQVSHGYGALAENSEDAQRYLDEHNHAMKWARASRALIAWRFLRTLGSDARNVLDASHNFVARELFNGENRWVHRKGSNPSTQGALVIPGSRGALSFLVAPVGEQSANARSVSHGAGRKWARGDCRARLRERFDESTLQRTAFGGRVICEDRDLLYEEAPQAYKNIEIVIDDLVSAGLVRVIATLRPLITYKVRRDRA